MQLLANHLDLRLEELTGLCLAVARELRLELLTATRDTFSKKAFIVSDVLPKRPLFECYDTLLAGQLVTTFQNTDI